MASKGTVVPACAMMAFVEVEGGQFHTLATLHPDKERIVELPIQYEAAWNTQPVSTLCGRDIFLAPAGNRTTTSRRQTCNLVTTATEIPQLQ